MSTHPNRSIEKGTRVRLHSGREQGTVERVRFDGDDPMRVVVRWDSGVLATWAALALVVIDPSEVALDKRHVAP